MGNGNDRTLDNIYALIISLVLFGGIEFLIRSFNINPAHVIIGLCCWIYATNLLKD